MTFPTEFRSQTKAIGSFSNLHHPIYTFTVNLDRFTTEAFGPATNQRSVTVLTPDQYQTSPELGRTQNLVRVRQVLSLFPGLLGGDNIIINDDGTVTAYGYRGKYLLDTYTTGSNPLLTLTNDAPYTSE